MTSIFGNVDDLYLFCVVIDEGSLRKAAKRLELPVSTMSRRLSSLEARLNIRLLQKQGRELVATEVGMQAYGSLVSGMEQVESAFTELLNQQTEVTGKLKITLPHNFYRGFAGEVIEAFLKQYPKVQLELVLNQHQEVPETDRHLVLTFDISNMQGMVARPLFTAQHGFFASHAFLEQNTLPEDIDELEQCRWISVNDETEIPIYKDEILCQVLNIKPTLVVNDIVSVVEAVEKGLGIASLPYTHALKSDKLVQIYSGYHRSDKQSYIVYKERKYQPKVLTLLVNALIEAAGTSQTKKEGINYNEN